MKSILDIGLTLEYLVSNDKPILENQWITTARRKPKESLLLHMAQLLNFQASILRDQVTRSIMHSDSYYEAKGY